MPKTQLKHNVALKTTVRQKLHGTLTHAVQLLSLPQHELREEVLRVIAENPFVEEISAGEAPPVGLAENKDFITKAHIGLQENLLLQLVDMGIPDKIYDLARIIVSTIDNDGFTAFPHRTIIADYNFTSRDLRACIEYLKQLEPCGVGAENLWQSLRWQAEVRYGKDELLFDLIDMLHEAREGLSRFSQSEKNSLCEILEIDPETLDAKIKLLTALDPHPVNRSDGSAAEWALPEIFFEVKEKQIYVRVSDQYLPRFRVNHKLYQQMMGKKGPVPKGDEAVATAARESDRQAEWQSTYQTAKSLIETLTFRADTLTQVAKIIAVKQYDFFTRGSAHIRTMSLKDLAHETKRHVSTISRILNRKYFHCSWGIFPLRLFLMRRIKSSDGSERSAEDLKTAILTLLAQDSERKKSDRMIAEILAEQGFEVKRRTVNKYRRLIHQSSSRKRTR
jgi:RNA polymerase sigma-54 factor